MAFIIQTSAGYLSKGLDTFTVWRRNAKRFKSFDVAMQVREQLNTRWATVIKPARSYTPKRCGIDIVCEEDVVEEITIPCRCEECGIVLEPIEIVDAQGHTVCPDCAYEKYHVRG